MRMTPDAFRDAFMHAAHVSASSAKTSAHVAFGSDDPATVAIHAVAQLMLAMHDGQRDEALRQVEVFFAAVEREEE